MSEYQELEKLADTVNAGKFYEKMPWLTECFKRIEHTHMGSKITSLDSEFMEEALYAASAYKTPTENYEIDVPSLD